MKRSWNTSAVSVSVHMTWAANNSKESDKRSFESEKIIILKISLGSTVLLDSNLTVMTLKYSRGKGRDFQKTQSTVYFLYLQL